MTPPMLKPGRFRALDKVLAMLSTVGRKPNYAERERRESRGGSELCAADSA